MGSSAIQMIGSLLSFDPEHRLSPEDALEHPFLCGYAGRNRETEYGFYGENLRNPQLQRSITNLAQPRTVRNKNEQMELYEESLKINIKKELDIYNRVYCPAGEGGGGGGGGGDGNRSLSGSY